MPSQLSAILAQADDRKMAQAVRGSPDPAHRKNHPDKGPVDCQNAKLRPKSVPTPNPSAKPETEDGERILEPGLVYSPKLVADLTPGPVNGLMMRTAGVSHRPTEWENDTMREILQTSLLLAVGLVLLCQGRSGAADPWVVYQGGAGPGQGKQIVLIAGDEEYRSEEALPALAKILAQRHGFDCTVLFSIDPEDGTIDPNNQENIPGIEKLTTADMMVIATRFRELPDEKMKYVDEFVQSGKPILGLRTATHAFNYERNKQSVYAKYGFRDKQWPGGFGQQVLGETWVNHHGHHGVESTRGVINPKFRNHPILRGVTDIWGPTDVYTVTHLPTDAKVLVFGQVLTGMRPTDPPNRDKAQMPLVWVREYHGEKGKTSPVICTTMGASVDLKSEGLRRLLVNACYWGLGLENKIPAQSNVDLVGPYDALMFGTNKFKPGVKPADLAL
jgi:type 1 glutamine amidotransferase